MDDPLGAFQARLGYAFLDPTLLQIALMHPSFTNEHPGERDARNDNGQLAFLGDAVLALAVSEDLLPAGGGKGTLTNARQARVSNAYLAEVAEWLAVPLRLGEGEKRNEGGREARFASGLEAVFGALHVDAGPAHALRVVNAVLAQHERARTARGIVSSDAGLAREP